VFETCVIPGRLTDVTEWRTSGKEDSVDMRFMVLLQFTDDWHVRRWTSTTSPTVKGICLEDLAPRFLPSFEAVTYQPHVSSVQTYFRYVPDAEATLQPLPCLPTARWRDSVSSFRLAKFRCRKAETDCIITIGISVIVSKKGRRKGRQNWRCVEFHRVCVSVVLRCDERLCLCWVWWWTNND
jgi:hypothetical protein